MTAFSELTAEILDACPQAPEPTIERAIRNTVIAFCSRTLLLRKTLTAITIQPDQALYTLIPPENREIIQIRNAQIEEDRSLKEYSEDHFDLVWSDPRLMRSDSCCTDDDGNVVASGDDWRQYTQARPQSYYVDRSENQYRMRLVGIPNQLIANGLVVAVDLKPSRTATEVDDWLFNDYFQTLIHGAKARMMEMPKQAWTEMELAGYHKAEFEEQTELARMKGQRSHIRNDQTHRRVRAWV